LETHRPETVSQPLQGQPSQRQLVTAIAWVQIEKIRLPEQIPIDRLPNAKIDSPALQKSLEFGL